jgi:hypothetical protein
MFSRISAMADIVLVRAFGGKPLRRVATGKSSRLIYVATPEAIPAEGIKEPLGVGFPPEDVFVYDSKAYDDLERVFVRTGILGRAEWRGKGLAQYPALSKKHSTK